MKRPRNTNDVDDVDDESLDLQNIEDVNIFIENMMNEEKQRSNRLRQKNIKKCEDFPQFQKDGVVLEEDEKKYIKSLKPLREVWGWKAGKNGEHINYEKKVHPNGTHPHLYNIVRYTDVLMWFLDTFEIDQKRALDEMFNKIKIVVPLHTHKNSNEYVNLIKDFLNQNNNKKILFGLATYFNKFYLEDTSITMYFLVQTAKALLRIGQGKLEDAYNIMDNLKTLIECYKNNYYQY